MSGRGGHHAPGGEDWRRARRAWIAAHHPDRGGDLEVFITGLLQWAWPPGPGGPRQAPVTAYYRRGPAGVWRWLARAARHRTRARATRRRARNRRVA